MRDSSSEKTIDGRFSHDNWHARALLWRLALNIRADARTVVPMDGLPKGTEKKGPEVANGSRSARIGAMPSNAMGRCGQAPDKVIDFSI